MKTLSSAICRCVLLARRLGGGGAARAGVVARRCRRCSDVVVSWIDLIKTGELVGNTGASLYRAAAGLLLAIVVGAALGIVMAWWKPVNVLLARSSRFSIRCRNRR